MEDQIVSFETAKLAKKKGFNYAECFYWYRTYSDYCFDDNIRSLEIGKHSIQTKNYYLAPTQSLLQKWLREKHSIHVNCMYLNRKNINGFFYGIIEFPEAENNIIYQSYEEALEKGLEESLKLI